jgi:PAS domain S-box-containing protein
MNLDCENLQQLDLISAIINHTAEGLYATDATGKIVFINPAAERMLGWSRDELIGKCAHELIHYKRADGNPFAEEDCPLLEVMRSGKTLHNHEDAFARKDGSLFPVLCSSTPIVKEGRVAGAIIAFQDITERKRAEAKLFQLASIIESSDDAIISIDLDGTIVSWNSGAERLYGYAANEIVGQHITRLLPPDLKDEAAEFTLRIKRGEHIEHYETARLRKDGALVNVSLTVSPVKDEKGRIIGISKIARDITERKRVEEALANQRRWLEYLLNLAPIPILLVEPNSARVLFANRAADEMSGNNISRDGHADAHYLRYPCTDARGQRIPADELPGARVARGERLEGFQMDWHTPYGKRSLLIYADILPSMHGHPATAIIICQDITEIKRIEEELRTANRLKDEFLATLSHELRTPLTAILGWSRMLLTGALDEATTKEALETIERNARAQSQLIEDLMDISRIITGKLRLDARPVDLASVIEATIASVRPAAEAKALRLQVVLDPLAGPVLGDPARLQQVLWNLLSNAIKFTPKGGSIQVRLERVDSHVEIAVSDTGQGIKPDFLPFVFDRFRQADATTARAHGGLGLGLAIVRHLVELHGGTVRVDSPGEGQGATFTVQLPIMIMHREASDKETRYAPSGPSSVVTPALDGLRVLVVEDEADARQLLAVALERHGAEVIAVSSAQEALAAIESATPDVIISDIGMPREDGYALIRKVRALPRERGGNIPAAALTAYAGSEDRKRALLAGFQAHIPKPVDPSELIAVVASLAGRTGTPSA